MKPAKPLGAPISFSCILLLVTSDEIVLPFATHFKISTVNKKPALKTFQTSNTTKPKFIK